MKDIVVFSRVSSREKVFFARQLAVMVSAGLTVDNAINLLKAQTKNQAMKKILDQVYQDILVGKPLSDSLARFPKVFDQFFIAVVRSGESLGKLDLVLNHLADRLEVFQTFSGKIKSALAYPIFVIVAMIGIVVLMMVKVIPVLKTVFEESGVELPFLTRMLMKMSDFMVKDWWVLLIILVFLTGIIWGFFRYTLRGKFYWHVIKLKTPLISYVSYDVYMARFARTMGMLIQAGIPIIEAIKITDAVVNNLVYTRIFRNVISQVERGIPMSVPLEKEKEIPVLVSQMIMIGEQTGRLEMLMNKVADFYEEETDRKIKTISNLIEPVTIVIVGIGVGLLLYSILYPIYSLGNAIK